ncbi:putative isochorismatase [Actinacidiphila reveromycinica]|uniref:Putative isochorismatase n=1 Tax=Actinacidiphila reveromycinica TaxID=659352 RepID=A0A7U3UWW8_9ACTN|nr:isochorismatase family protein [Streptomyces sp. SN-593]BBB00127.1 putative isochorismatase [Streptomyces sp. SN-593]
MARPVIPEITPYPMPSPAALPENTASWTLDPDRAVLLVHDMQRYFLRPIPEGRSLRADLVRNCVALREAAAAAGVPVHYTAQPGGMTPEDRGLLMDFWGPGMDANPEHRAIIDELEPRPDDTVLVKWRPSAYFRTPLLESLRASGRDQLVVCGVYAHVGILQTAAEGCAHGIRTFLAGDAVADFSAAHHRMSLEYAATRCAMVLPTSALLSALPARSLEGDPA